MTRREVALDSLLKRAKPSSRPVRRLLWRRGILGTWLLNPSSERGLRRGR